MRDIWYVVDWGYGHHIYRESLSTGDISVIKGDDGPGHDRMSSQMARLEASYVRLKQVDLSRLGLAFETELLSGRVYNSDGTVDDRVYLWGNYIGVGLRWKIAAHHGGRESGAGDFHACAASDRVDLRGYSLPGEDFVLIVAASLANCFEYGYIAESGFVARDVAVSEEDLVAASGVVSGYPESNEVRGSVSIALGEQKVARFLNRVGMQAYREGKYPTAIEYFRYAHGKQSDEPDYLLPLYNLACTLAKTGQADRAFERLRRLLAFEGTRLKFMKKIRNDPDFDSLRDDERYAALFQPGGGGD